MQDEVVGEHLVGRIDTFQTEEDLEHAVTLGATAEAGAGDGAGVEAGIREVVVEKVFDRSFPQRRASLVYFSVVQRFLEPIGVRLTNVAIRYVRVLT